MYDHDTLLGHHSSSMTWSISPAAPSIDHVSSTRAFDQFDHSLEKNNGLQCWDLCWRLHDSVRYMDERRNSL